MKQSSSLVRDLANAQERHATVESIAYYLYTEDKPNLHELTARYFQGATIFHADGLWTPGLSDELSQPTVREQAAVIGIIGTRADKQRIFDLAGDIRHVNTQSSVLVTWHAVSRFDVVEPKA